LRSNNPAALDERLLAGIIAVIEVTIRHSTVASTMGYGHPGIARTQAELSAVRETVAR
jgi:hypothetical protein